MVAQSPATRIQRCRKPGKTKLSVNTLATNHAFSVLTDGVPIVEYRAWSERFEEARRQKELVEWEHIAAGEDGEVTVRQVRSTAPKGLFYKEETFTGLPKAEK